MTKDLTATEAAYEEQLIEKVARAICAGHGWNPDETVPDPRTLLGRIPMWMELRQQAVTQIAAFRALSMEPLSDIVRRIP